MADRIVWSQEAIEDIEAIAAYIERDSPHYARVVASRLVEAAEAIPDFPKIGRVVPEAGEPNLRERFVYSYRLIYRLQPGRILIVAVIHGSRLLQPFLRRIGE